MSTVLVIAELAEGKVRKSTMSAIAFARTAAKDGGSFSILALGAGAKAASAELAAYGAARLLVGDDPAFGQQICERFAPTIAAVATYTDSLVKTPSGWRFSKRMTHSDATAASAPK